MLTIVTRYHPVRDIGHVVMSEWSTGPDSAKIYTQGTETFQERLDELTELLPTLVHDNYQYDECSSAIQQLSLIVAFRKAASSIPIIDRRYSNAEGVPGERNRNTPQGRRRHNFMQKASKIYRKAAIRADNVDQWIEATDRVQAELGVTLERTEAYHQIALQFKTPTGSNILIRPTQSSWRVGMGPIKTGTPDEFLEWYRKRY